MEDNKKKTLIIRIISIVLGGWIAWYLAYIDSNWETPRETPAIIEYAWEEQLQEYLTWSYLEAASGYMIPEEFLINYPDVVKLILWSTTLRKREDKQEWFDMYKDMNEEQIESLRDILQRENDQLKTIEEEYKGKINGFINE